MEPQTQNQSSIGSIIGIIIIITVIILGGLYFWGKRVEEQKYNEKLISESKQNTEPTVINESTQIKNLAPGDDVDSIQADLNSTKTDNLSTELDTQVQ
jgi:uncharacterized protein HemX